MACGGGWGGFTATYKGPHNLNNICLNVVHTWSDGKQKKISPTLGSVCCWLCFHADPEGRALGGRGTPTDGESNAWDPMQNCPKISCIWTADGIRPLREPSSGDQFRGHLSTSHGRSNIKMAAEFRHQRRCASLLTSHASPLWPTAVEFNRFV
jgi:hypothetical protein